MESPIEIYIKSNQTLKERQQEKALRNEVASLRAALTETDNQFPVIRNREIIF